MGVNIKFWVNYTLLEYSGSGSGRCVNCTSIVRQLYVNCTSIVRQLYVNCTSIVRQLYVNCTSIVRQLYVNCTSIVRQLYVNCTSIVRQLYVNCTSIVRQLYVNCTSIVRYLSIASIIFEGGGVNSFQNINMKLIREFGYRAITSSTISSTSFNDGEMICE